jgi:hypothetical protein
MQEKAGMTYFNVISQNSTGGFMESSTDMPMMPMASPLKKFGQRMRTSKMRTLLLF